MYWPGAPLVRPVVRHMQYRVVWNHEVHAWREVGHGRGETPGRRGGRTHEACHRTSEWLPWRIAIFFQDAAPRLGLTHIQPAFPASPSHGFGLCAALLRPTVGVRRTTRAVSHLVIDLRESLRCLGYMDRKSDIGQGSKDNQASSH